MGINMVMDMDTSMGMVTWLKHVEKGLISSVN